VALASQTQRLRVSLTAACDAILDGYRKGLEKGGETFVVDEDWEWLSKAYVKSEHLAEKYWKNLNQCPASEKEPTPEIRSMLEASLPSQGLEYRLVHRQAGVGSLGRPRCTQP